MEYQVVTTAKSGPHSADGTPEKTYTIKDKDIRGKDPTGTEIRLATLNHVSLLLRHYGPPAAADEGVLTVRKTSRGYFTTKPVSLTLHVYDGEETEIWKGTFRLELACTDKGTMDGRTYSLPTDVFDRAADFEFDWGASGKWDNC
jgi:hypothetical protein